MCTRDLDLDLGYGDVLWRFKLVKYWHRLKVQPLPSVFANGHKCFSKICHELKANLKDTDSECHDAGSTTHTMGVRE